MTFFVLAMTNAGSNKLLMMNLPALVNSIVVSSSMKIDRSTLTPMSSVATQSTSITDRSCSRTAPPSGCTQWHALCASELGPLSVESVSLLPHAAITPQSSRTRADARQSGANGGCA